MAKKSKPLPRPNKAKENVRLPSERKWQRARAVMLRERAEQAAGQDRAICVDCARDGVMYPGPAVDGHHLIERTARPDLVLDPRNVVFVCKKHHALRESLGR